MNSVKKTAVAVALGSVVMSSAFAVNAQTNPFGFEAMDAGYQIVGSEGKCGEAKCGADMKKAAAEKAAGISSNWVFLLGLGLLSLFVVYFAAESARRKRIVGTILSISVAALCVWLYQGLGMEKGIELQGGISMEIKIQPSGLKDMPHQMPMS